MAAKDNVLLSSDPVFKDVLLEMLEGCRDLGEATARMSETVLNALMSMQADEACGAPWGECSEERASSGNGYRERGPSATAGELALEVPKLRKGTYFPDDILAGSLYGALGVPADALADAAAYTRVWAAGLPGAFLLSAAVAVVRARGDARTPMWLAVAVAAVNCAGACLLRSYAAVKVRVPSAG